MDSILTSIKELLGITYEHKHFDNMIIAHINSVFMILNQLGVGPKEGFSIKDEKATWTDFTQGATNIEAVKSYVHLKVKLLFDPPLSSAVKEATNQSINELEWRLNIAVDPADSTES